MKSIFYLMICIFSCSNIILSDQEQSNISSKIITDSINIAEDITGLVVTCKDSKDPKLLKTIIKKLIIDIAEITEAIIEKRKQKKASRTLSLEQFDFTDISSDPLQLQINEIAKQVINNLEKIESK